MGRDSVIVFLMVLLGSSSFYAPNLHSATGEQAGRTSTNRAERLYSKAMEAVKAGELDLAARLFDAAFAMDPHPTLLWNAARAFDGVGDWYSALKRYRQLVAHPDTSEARLKTATARISEIEVQQGDGFGKVPGRDPGLSTEGSEDLPERTSLVVDDSAQPEGHRVTGWVLVGIGAASLLTGSIFTYLAVEGDRKLSSYDAWSMYEDEAVARNYENTEAEYERDVLLSAVFCGVGTIVVVGGLLHHVFGTVDAAEQSSIESKNATITSWYVAPIHEGALVGFDWVF